MKRDSHALTVRNRSEKGAALERSWCGLGTDLVRTWYGEGVSSPEI